MTKVPTGKLQINGIGLPRWQPNGRKESSDNKMTKFLNKWTRKFHRWIAIPTIIIIPLAVITKFSGDATGHLPPQLEQLQSILMLLLVISGTYLYLIPYIARRQRSRRARTKKAAQPSTLEKGIAATKPEPAELATGTIIDSSQP